jgi:hypothetical protein
MLKLMGIKVQLIKFTNTTIATIAAQITKVILLPDNLSLTTV